MNFVVYSQARRWWNGFADCVCLLPNGKAQPHSRIHNKRDRYSGNCFQPLGYKGQKMCLPFELLFYFAEAPAYLIDLMHDKNCEIRKLCDACLDVIKVRYSINSMISIELFVGWSQI